MTNKNFIFNRKDKIYSNTILFKWMKIIKIENKMLEWEKYFKKT